MDTDRTVYLLRLRKRKKDFQYNVYFARSLPLQSVVGVANDNKNENEDEYPEADKGEVTPAAPHRPSVSNAAAGGCKSNVNWRLPHDQK